MLYLEDTNSEVVHLVKLYMDAAPRLFKFILPIELIRGRINSIYNANDNNFLVPQDRKMPSPPKSVEQEFTEDQDRALQSPTGHYDADNNLLKSMRSLMKTTKNDDIAQMIELGEIRHDQNASEAS